MELIPVELMIRGKAVAFKRPGRDASPETQMLQKLDALLIAVIALEDPRVDAALEAFGIELDVVGEDGEVVALFPPRKDPA